MGIRTHYDNLQVVQTASPEVIKGAYRYLTQRWHPDRNPDNRAEAERITRLVNEAYRVLSDPELRQAHDMWIRSQESGPAAQAEPEIAPQPPPQPPRTPEAAQAPTPKPPTRSNDSRKPAAWTWWLGVPLFMAVTLVRGSMWSGLGVVICWAAWRWSRNLTLAKRVAIVATMALSLMALFGPLL